MGLPVPLRQHGRFGRRKSDIAPHFDPKHLHFADYATALPTPPASFDILSRVLVNLPHESIPSLFPMDGNDTVGDCTLAGACHAQTIGRALTGALSIVPASKCLDIYYELTGGQDTGLYLSQVISWWRTNALAGDKILCSVAVNPANPTEVQQALALTGYLYIGFSVPSNCIPQFDARQPWTGGTLTEDGHCVVVTGYGLSGEGLETGGLFRCLTWGDDQYGTIGWWQQCVDEAHILIPSEALAHPDEYMPGFDFKTLQQDAKQLAA
jgi:hypothetical protein